MGVNIPRGLAALAQAENAYSTSTFSSSATSTFGLVASDTVLGTVLAFRGTSDLANWYTDFDSDPKPEGVAGNVVDGFQKALDSVWVDVLHQTIAARKIFVTGHSLGGALAQLAGFRLANAGLADVEVMTFGEPRLGDKSFGVSYQKLGIPTTRWVNYGDPVPWVPPGVTPYLSLKLSPYSQTGDPVVLMPDGTMHSPPRWRELFRDWICSWSPWKFVGSIEAHLTGAYHERMVLASGRPDMIRAYCHPAPEPAPLPPPVKECRCPCHTNVDIRHVVACCKRCSACRKNFKSGFEEHAKACLTQ